MKTKIAFLVVALTFLSTFHIVSAHAIAVACLPRMGINVTQPPAQIICQFSQPLQPSTISMQVTDANGNRVDKNDTHFYENDDWTLVVSLDTSKMPAGIYTVKWQVTDTLDFGQTSSTFQFGVNTVVPPTPTAVLPGVAMTPTPIQPQPSSSSPTDLISRFLIGVGIVLLVAMGVLFWRTRTSKDAPEE